MIVFTLILGLSKYQKIFARESRRASLTVAGAFQIQRSARAGYDCAPRLPRKKSRYLDKHLCFFKQIYANSRNETGSISPMASSFLMATFAIFAQGQTREELYTELNLRSTEEVRY